MAETEVLSAEEKARRAARNLPGRMAGDLFENPDFQAKMNRWMIGTHISWGFMLAVMFIGLNYAVIWATQTFVIPPWLVAVTFAPIGAGYTLYQVRKYRKPKTTAPMVESSH